MKNFKTVTLLAFVCCTVGQTAYAHFPWLIVNEDKQAALFFGEDMTDRTYTLPDSLKEAELRMVTTSGTRNLPLRQIATDQFVGLVSKSKISGNGQVATNVTYGIYHGNRLNYFASHFCGKLPTARSRQTGDQNNDAFSTELIATELGVDVFVSWNGEPLAETEIHLYCSEGHEEAAATTDKTGKASFSDKDVEAGLNGLMFGHTAADSSGKLDGESYKSTMYYATVTFVASAESKETQVQFDDLPYEITSFGAARVANTAYVYGGHTGDAHSYSTGEQSNQLLALDLSDADAKWTTASKGDKLQGLAMVPHESQLILIGGFTAKNAPGEEHDLHSQTSVRAFDTRTRKWSDLPSLPSGRSSHDAAVIGDKVYVVGGWTMDGEKEIQWQSSALHMDLAASEPKWEETSQPPFVRRALATVAHNGNLWVIGGMDQKGGPTKAVAIYNPQTDSWTDGPELPGKGSMAGFGAAGWSVGNKLIVSTYEGDILQLAADGMLWETNGKSEGSRFFHRLVPLANDSVIAVGGANMEAGKFLNLEVLKTED